MQRDIYLVLNQIRAKVGVIAPHPNFEVGVNRSKRDDVTSFQVENTTCVHRTFVTFPWPTRLNHGHGFVIYFYIDPSLAVAVIDLQIDIVPSSGRHGQFSIIHAAGKMAVRVTNRPVFDH